MRNFLTRSCTWLFSVLSTTGSIYNIDYSPDKSGPRNTPVFNINFLNAFVFAAFFSLITFLNNNKKYTAPEFSRKYLKELFNYSIPAMLLIVIYAAFRNEIAVYWDQLYADYTQLVQPETRKDFQYWYNQDYIYFKKIWILNYTMLFLSTLAFVNIKYLKVKESGPHKYVFTRTCTRRISGRWPSCVAIFKRQLL